MKYKILGVFVCTLAIVASIFAPAFEEKTNNRFVQHIDSTALTNKGDSDFSSNLPLALVDTENSQIKIVNNDTYYNEVNDNPEVTSNAKITEYYESEHSNKKSFNIELTDKSGKPNPEKIMGMGSNSKWVLSSLANDKSLLKNYIWYNVSGKIMDYAPNVRFCEVFEDGHYAGLYLMIESVTAGDDKIRITNDSGYVLSLGTKNKNSYKSIETFSTYTLRNKKTLAVEYPSATNQNKKDIIADFSYFEKSLYSYDFNSSKFGYRESTDAECFAQYFLINEFAGNVRDDLSLYIYKDYSKRLHLAVGDFTFSCNNRKLKMDNFELQNTLWYFMMFKDEKFTKQVIADYQKYSGEYLNSDYIDSFINGTKKYISAAAKRNNMLWNISNDDYEKVSDDIKLFVQKRSSWMNKYIKTISQYSAESKVKKFAEVSN